jgi:pSer/pThr/pTyr-binding forkhead associated (FHA) protein
MLLQSSQQSPSAVPPPVITLTLLHPIQSTPVQSWRFEQEDEAIRIGRATDNHVVLYSAVVSRNHVELRHNGQVWEVVSLGANGTYVDGKRVMRMPLHDGLVFRLARSGPNLQVHIGAESGQKVAATLKSPPRNVSSRVIPMPASDDMPNTLGLPGADQNFEEVAAQFNLKPTALGDMPATAEKPNQTPELLFSTITGQPLKVLQMLGDYQVVKLLGQGTTGVTSMAWRLGRTVVIKNLNAQTGADSEAVQVFRELSQKLKQVNHPGIPRVLELLELDGKSYAVMEMVYGQTLSQYVATHGVLPQREAIAWMLELCETLSFMQGEGLVHGHITPDHVMRRSVIRSGQSIVLMDFGAVRLHHWQNDGGFDATSYLAPEQQQGETTLKSDFYGLGTTLAFLLTGQPPKQFYTQQTSGLRFDPTRLPGISGVMVQLLQQLTHPNPEERPTSIEALMKSLQQIV